MEEGNIILECPNPECGMTLIDVDSNDYQVDVSGLVVTCKLCGWQLRERYK